MLPYKNRKIIYFLVERIWCLVLIIFVTIFWGHHKSKRHDWILSSEISSLALMNIFLHFITLIAGCTKLAKNASSNQVTLCIFISHVFWLSWSRPYQYFEVTSKTLGIVWRINRRNGCVWWKNVWDSLRFRKIFFPEANSWVFLW